ncbi:MAG TPA: MBOAT family O-acyltransferase [Candidatus Limnocylindrales bacterium]|jgi:D-alanyl-lipoteichoic acid acyltransferase DltB (MBOAT superfamily)|nr:MBOAT family O-acyltransferase [Candidatus Limnocylindrales bacterium]
MLFPTVDFAVFFALVFLGHWLLNPKPLPWKLFMIGASYVFYAWWDVHFIWLLAGVSAISQVGAVAVSRQTEEMRRRIAMAVGVGFTLLPLLYFKYYSWASLELTNAAADLGFGSLGLPLVQLILPVGISFFTFMAISYIVDVYRGHTQVASWIDVFLYLSFFPHLVAGPIVRPDELIPQLDVRRDPRHIDVAGASWLILGGLFKKVVVSSYLAANVVDPVFGEPGAHSALDAIVAVMAYAIVIYADFSGYTDIAIGVAKMLGFQFPQNFDRPYSARSLQDFWRRWHITLSRWLRDYLYIPLGGSKRGERRTYVNIVATMVLGGLWHGADWTFVFWGLYHGVGQAIGAWKRIHLPPRAETAMLVLGQRVATFALVCVGWVFFRADSMATAFELLGRMVVGWATPSVVVTPLVVGTIAAMLALQYAPREPGLRLQAWISTWHPVPMGLAGALALFVIATLGPQGVAPFIYFQF